jgi:hypothetical protein
LFNGASTADFAALGVPRSLVYPSTAALSSRLQQHGVGTQQSSNNTFRLLQQGNVSEFSAALTVAEANNNNDVTDNVAGETTQHTGYSRQFHRYCALPRDPIRRSQHEQWKFLVSRSIQIRLASYQKHYDRSNQHQHLFEG